MESIWKQKEPSFIVADTFKYSIPLLNNIDIDELDKIISKLPYDFYKKDEAIKVNIWLRLTLPFVLVVMILLIVFMPIKFIFTGRWRYAPNIFIKWFKLLDLA